MPLAMLQRGSGTYKLWAWSLCVKFRRIGHLNTFRRRGNLLKRPRI